MDCSKGLFHLVRGGVLNLNLCWGRIMWRWSSQKTITTSKIINWNFSRIEFPKDSLKIREMIDRSIYVTNVQLKNDVKVSVFSFYLQFESLRLCLSLSSCWRVGFPFLGQLCKKSESIRHKNWNFCDGFGCKISEEKSSSMSKNVAYKIFSRQTDKKQQNKMMIILLCSEKFPRKREGGIWTSHVVDS